MQCVFSGIECLKMSSMERASVEPRKILKSIKIKPTKAPMISPVDLLSAMKALARKEQEGAKSDRSKASEEEKQ